MVYSSRATVLCQCQGRFPGVTPTLQMKRMQSQWPQIFVTPMNELHFAAILPTIIKFARMNRTFPGKEPSGLTLTPTK